MSRVSLTSHDVSFSEEEPVDSNNLTKGSRPLETELRLQKEYKKGFGALFLMLFLAWLVLQGQKRLRSSWRWLWLEILLKQEQ